MLAFFRFNNRDGREYDFSLNRDTVQNLADAAKEFFSDDSYTCIKLDVDKDSFELKKLAVIKDIIQKCRQEKINIKINGVPFCVYKILLGNDYMRNLSGNFIFEKEQAFDITGYRMQLCCGDCEANVYCLGLGSVRENMGLSIKHLLVSTEYKKKLRDSFHFEGEAKDYYENVCKYLDKRKNFISSRDVIYASVYTDRPELEYKYRYVFGCHYLLKEELEEEAAFLKDHIHYPITYEILMKMGMMNLRSYGYSRSFGTRAQDTIYFNFNNSKEAEKYLKDEGFLYSKNDFENKPDLLGHDIADNRIAGTKIYCLVKNIDAFLKYAEKEFGIEFSKELQKHVYCYWFVRRYDKDKKLKSYKIELETTRIRQFNKIFCEEFGVHVEAFENLKKAVYSIDPEPGGTISKATVYYTV